MAREKSKAKSVRLKLTGLPPAINREVPPPPFSLDADIRELIISKLVFAGHLALSGVDQHLQSYGLILPQVPILAILESEGEQSQVALTKSSCINRSTMVAFIDELEEQGLVKRKSDPNDRRINLVSLTAKGKKVIVDIKTEYKLVEDEVIGRLTRDERQVMRALLDKLLQT